MCCNELWYSYSLHYIIIIMNYIIISYHLLFVVSFFNNDLRYHYLLSLENGIDGISTEFNYELRRGYYTRR